MEDIEKGNHFWTKFLSLVFFLGILVLLGVYWFFPYENLEFVFTAKNPEFILDNSSLVKMQFYENLRYPDKRVSYRISDDCSLQKTNDMKYAFEILENLTILDFYEVDSEEEITITCDDDVKVNGDYFIAGEGGPTNITQTDSFNVITHGMVLLIEDSKCELPNVAIHELLHALGFEHSANENNIMYNVSKCSQRIGDGIPSLIDKIYSVESLADLDFDFANASISGRYLDVNFVVNNNGLKRSDEAKVVIYADDENVKEFDLVSLGIGEGVRVYAGNVLISQFSVDKISLEIESDFSELSQKNNKIELEIKT